MNGASFLLLRVGNGTAFSARRQEPMTTQKIYQLPVEVTNWKFDGATEIAFNWEYDAGSSDLLNLYEKGKQQQWDTSTRLDWSQELFEGNPMGMSDETIPIYGSPFWEKMTEKERHWLRFNLQGHSICQVMHSTQGALIATAKIVNTVPDMNAKFYAATQVMDEARHVETYERLIHEKFKAAYPITDSLKNLLEQTLSDRRWDMTYLGMQVLIEGLALAAFQRIRDTAKNNLAGAERAEREEFTVEALYFMRDRFNQAEVWMRSGLPVDKLMEYAYNSGSMQSFRSRLFTRIVPILKEIGLFGPKVQKALGDMGVMEYAKIDVEKLLGNDLKVAEDFDAKKFVKDAIAAE